MSIIGFGPDREKTIRLGGNSQLLERPKFAGILGLGRDEMVKDEEDGRDSTGAGSGVGDKRRADNRPTFRETGLPTKGFSVPVHVSVERSNPGPVLLPCSAGDGGVQEKRM
ncbi:PREDICTED: uncharacterized protein LOC104806720 [Tarenaya hassleriana]|uniref:uncharacterized protein LOC104806720 n=1 Tax=Tarenaya hassleriana TaxID=28532 RepID=UPI0008FD53ED|nr:PREDICTED: uncharacterized protein LOC104806720 [Tarenaya hassleriana]